MVSIDQISKTFAGRTLFKNVSFSVEPGSSVSIMGPSGSGKTTLLKIIAGLESSDSGVVKLGSQKVAMVFQKNALFDSMTVLENLLVPLREVRRLKKSELKPMAQQALLRVGLEGQESLFPGELSGGMQKRLAIARALAIEPEVLLCDEPTAGLDPIRSRQIGQLLRTEHQRLGFTLLVVTSDVQLAMLLGDRLHLLALEQLHMGGSKSEIEALRSPLFSQFLSGSKTGPIQRSFS